MSQLELSALVNLGRDYGFPLPLPLFNVQAVHAATASRDPSWAVSAVDPHP